MHAPRPLESPAKYNITCKTLHAVICAHLAASPSPGLIQMKANAPSPLLVPSPHGSQRAFHTERASELTAPGLQDPFWKQRPSPRDLSDRGHWRVERATLGVGDQAGTEAELGPG